MSNPLFIFGNDVGGFDSSVRYQLDMNFGGVLQYANLTSVFQLMTGVQVAAISADTGTPAAICTVALQQGLDTLILNTYPTGTYLIDASLLIKNGTPRVTIRGNTRIRSLIEPSAVNIAAGAANVNAMFIIQDNNAHFCVENIAISATVSYTGAVFYCLENGCADGSGQCWYSGIVRNLFVYPPSTNGGFLYGGTQNTIFDTITFENLKGCFTLVGVGNGDNFYTNCSLYNCYDQFILQTADTNGSVAATVKGIHAYNHNRGRLFDIQNWAGGSIDDVQFEANAGNLGQTGVGRFKSCNGTLLSNIYALSRAGVPACAIGLEFDTFVGKVTQGAINADIGIRLSGTGVMSLDIVNFDFTNCSTACMQFFGNFTGTIRTRGCKFNSSQGYCAVFQVVGSNDWYSTDDEFLDAGLSGTTSFRNIDLTTGGKVVMTRPKIGRTTGSAVASAWIEATGTGTVDIYDPIFIGTPPVSIISSLSTQAINIHVSPTTGVTRVSTATYTVLDSDRDIITTVACTLTLPTAGSTGASYGRRITVRNVSAGATISASSNICPAASLTPGSAICASNKSAEIVYETATNMWQTQMSN